MAIAPPSGSSGAWSELACAPGTARWGTDFTGDVASNVEEAAVVIAAGRGDSGPSESEKRLPGVTATSRSAKRACVGPSTTRTTSVGEYVVGCGVGVGDGA